jgi:hypothetical protein
MQHSIIFELIWSEMLFVGDLESIDEVCLTRLAAFTY